MFRFGKDPIPENVIVDCEEPNAKVFAVLIDAETKQEAEIGSYLLHSDTCTFDTISENIEAAFRQLGAFMYNKTAAGMHQTYRRFSLWYLRCIQNGDSVPKPLLGI